MEHRREHGTSPDAPGVGELPEGVSALEVRLLLQDILRSKAFAMSRRCSDLLSFVVERTLDGMQHELKERTIGVAVFGRPATYDTSEDAVVRIKASETRKRLAAYYAERGGAAALMIGLDAGSYVPQFTRTETAGSLSPVAVVPASRAPSFRAALGVAWRSLPKLRRWHWTALAVTVVALLAFPAAQWILEATRPSPLVQFWNPVLRGPSPVFLVNSSVPAYVFYDAEDTPTGKIPADYVLTTDQFVGRGDMLASERISGLLRVLGRSIALKASDTINMREMAGHSVVLIGYASSRWPALSKSLRFFVDDDQGGMVTDYGKATDWFPHHLTRDLHTDEDYAVVARIHDPETRAVVVLVSGSTQYGTEAAANFVTNPEMLAEAMRNRPRDWSKGNIQLVLHMKVIDNTPAAPEVIAAEFR